MATLAIDASLYCSGYAVMDEDVILAMGRHFTTKCKATPTEDDRILSAYEFFRYIIENPSFNITRVALESQYVGKNAKTSMILSRLRGAFIILCMTHHVPIHYYEPSQVKAAVCGDRKGNADKFAVYEGIRALYAGDDLVELYLPEGGCVDAHNKAKNDDISDALAVAHTDLLQCKLAMSV